MTLDRERFLALALGLAACAGAKHVGPSDEFGYPGDYADPYADPDCTGVDYAGEYPKCVAWQSGRVKRGYAPTQECARWDDAGRCNMMEFARTGTGD